MNYLAHLYLSSPDGDLMAGGFLGDFVKGQLKGTYSAPIESGIRLHRHIDSFTDQHPVQKRLKRQLPERFWRYSGIISDMMCDHFLSIHWSAYHSSSLPAFNQHSVDQLNNRKNGFPLTARTVLERLDSGDWLLNYHRIEYVVGALTRIGQRMRYANPLSECKEVLPALSDKMEADCLKILNDTRATVRKWLKKELPETAL